MKVKIEFDLSYGHDDVDRWKTFQRAEGHRRVIEELDEQLRSLSKYEDVKWATEARAMLAELLKEFVFDEV